jgi:MFS family permease
MKRVRGGEKKVTAEHPIVAKKIKKSLNLSIKEGGAASVAGGFGLSYFSPFALAMNATSSQIGILHAIIGLLPGIAQINSFTLLEKFSRKKIVLFGVLVKVLLFIPIILTGLLYYRGADYAVWILIGLVSLYYICGGINHPAWFSWMGSLVPESERGRYFSKRNRHIGLLGIITMIVGALILDFFKDLGSVRGDILGYTLFGFGILFSLAMIFRTITLILLKKQYEPKLKIKKKDEFSLLKFLKEAPSNPFGRFTIYRGLFSVAIGISGPFWAVYLLRDLEMSYIWFMAIMISGAFFQLIFLPAFGKASDRFGNIKLLKICSRLSFLIPLLWIFSSFMGNIFYVKLYLLFVPAIVAGFVWAGHNLAANNYAYDALKSGKRAFGTAYMNLIVGIGTFVGAGLGSLIALSQFVFMNTLLFIFLISGVLRFFVSFIGGKYLEEVRPVKKFSPQFFVKELEPREEVIREVHYLEHLAKKVEHYI